MRYVLLLLLLTSLFPPASESQDYGWRLKLPGFNLTVGINPDNPNAVIAEGGGNLIVSYDKGGTWTELGNPGLSGIRQILVHPSDTTVIFCLAFTGGLRRTSDYGATWTTVLPGIGIDGESLCLDPVHPDTLYVGNYDDGAVHRSTDRGLTWELLSNAGSELCTMAVRPDSSEIVFAGTGNGTISKSTDAGLTWREVKEGGSFEIPKIVVNPTDPLTAYAAGYEGEVSARGIWKSTDGGEGWFLTGLADTSIWGMDIDNTNPATVYAGLFSAGSGVFMTSDGGTTWEIIANGLPEDFNAWSIKVHPIDPEMVWLAGGSGIYRLVPSLAAIEGAVLDAVSLDTVKNGFIELASTGERVSLDQSGGLFSFHYYDGDPSLTPTAHGEAFPYYLHDEEVEFILDSTLERNIYLTRLPFSSVTGSVEDSVGHFPISAEISLTATGTGGTEVYAAATNPDGTFEIDSLYITYPPIIQYEEIRIDGSFPYGSSTVSPVFLDSSLYVLSAAIDTADVLITSSAGSGDYTRYFEGPLDAIGLSHHYWDPAADGPSPLSRTGEVRKGLFLYYTGDDTLPLPPNELDSLETALELGVPMMISGQNFVEANGGSNLVSQTFGLAHGGTANTTICLGVEGDLFDGVLVFTSGGDGADNQTSRDILQITGGSGVPVVNYGLIGNLGTSGVRFLSTDLGANVLLFGFGLEAVNLEQRRDTMMQTIIGYLDGSIVLDVEDDGEEIPLSFGLEQNYPNPFNPTTEIGYRITKTGRVSLKIFDVLGREIVTLVDEKQEAGYRKAGWDASGQPSGVYFYRLEVRHIDGMFEETKRMILLK